MIAPLILCQSRDLHAYLCYVPNPHMQWVVDAAWHLCEAPDYRGTVTGVDLTYRKTTFANNRGFTRADNVRLDLNFLANFKDTDITLKLEMRMDVSPYVCDVFKRAAPLIKTWAREAIKREQDRDLAFSAGQR